MIRLHGAGKHQPRKVALALAAKAVLILAFVVAPTELAVSLGAVHGVALAVFATVAAVVLVIRRRRRAAPTHHSHSHEYSHGYQHGSAPTPGRQPAAETVGEGEGV